MELDQELKKEYPFQSNFLNIDGNNYHYLDEGSGDVIILVHGNPTWSFYYRHIIKFLAQTHRVIVPDHMGCGLSDQPQNYEYTLENRISDLNLLVKFLDLERYSMIVHDWGGAIGFGHAVDHSNQVEKMVILNTAAFLSQTIPFSIGLCKNKYFGDWIVRNLNAFCYPATFMTTERKLTKVEKRGYLLPYQGASRRKAISEFVRDIPLDKDHRSYNTLKHIEDNLHLLTKKKLILWGGKDFCFNDEFFTRWREIYPSAEYRYYANAGHYVIEDAKSEVLSELGSFFKD